MSNKIQKCTAPQAKGKIERPYQWLQDHLVRPCVKSVKDIFCLRLDRVADAYRKISIKNLILKINKVNPRDQVQLRIYPLKNDICEIRFWVKNELVDIQKSKNLT